MGSDTTRSAIIGLVAFIIGIGLGLTYAWVISPATYSGGAFPNELEATYQKLYVKSVAEAYISNNQPQVAANRLNAFNNQETVKLLGQVANDYDTNGQTTELQSVMRLAGELRNIKSWTTKDIADGLQQASANDTFANSLGQTGIVSTPATEGTPATGVTEPPPTGETEGTSIGRIIAYVVLFILLVIVVVIIMIRQKGSGKAGYGTGEPLPEELTLDDGSELLPLRQWVGTFTMGQDNYDESFTVETADGDFMGECGMGILEGFASGSPKKVLAFDVWLFDKTDIRTVSMPVMSKFAYEDEVLRGKMPPESTPVLATEGATFDIETTAMLVKAKLEEVAYGDGPPDMSYFTTLRVSLSAYLRPGIDTASAMPIPEGYE